MRKLAVFLLPIFVAVPASAETVLERIARTGRITVGHRQTESPFSYVADGRVTGYSTEICLRVIAGMKPDLGVEKLEIAYLPVATATRFILLASGKIDLECAATTNTEQRRKQAEFSYPHFVTATRFVSRRRDKLETVADLAGRSVVSTTGTINMEQLNTVNRERNLNISVMLSRGHGEAFELVRQGRASAFVMDDILLAGLIAFSDEPEEYSISREALSAPEPYGIMLPPGDAAFKALFNREMLKLFENGAMAELYERWFRRPLPPDGRTMDLPISAELQAVFDAPRLPGE